MTVMVKPRFSGEEEVEVARRYAGGETFYALAKEYGCSVKAVRRACNRQGIKSRGSNKDRKLTTQQIDDATRFYVDNPEMSVSEIARRLGVSQSTLNHSFRRRGVKIRGNYARGEQHGMWKGGRREHRGYYKISIPEHDWCWPMSYAGIILEHRYVMARHLGRLLSSDQTVHHINGNGKDNRIENLKLYQSRHVGGAAAHCGDCGSINITFY